jgi:hypothetical protein
MKKTMYFLFALSIMLSACKPEPKTTTATEKANPAVETVTVSNPANTKPSQGPNSDLLTLSKIYLQYKNNGVGQAEKVSAALAEVKNPEMEFVKQFVYECTQQSPKLLSLEFMRKPSKENLQRIFKLRRVNWNSMSMTGVTTVVLDTFNIDRINNEELLTAYYRMVVDGVQPYNPSPVDFSQSYIDFDQLQLESKREKAIAFYTTVDGFAQKYNIFVRSNDNCAKAKELAATFPRINGKVLFAATPPPFEDFKVTIANNSVNKSFKESFVGNFENGRKHYDKCR